MAACAVGALTALTGCSLTGDLWGSQDDLRIDIQVRYEPTDNISSCTPDNLPPGLTQEPMDPASDEVAACRITGTIPFKDAAPDTSWLHFIMGTYDGFVTMLLPAAGMGVEANSSIDLTAHLPGEVVAVAGGGVVEGTTVRWTDIDTVRAQGLAFTARTRPALPGWVVPAAAGLAVGASAVAGVAWWRGRRQNLPGVPEDATQPDTQAEPAASEMTTLDVTEATPPPEPEDPEVWSRP